MKSNIVSTIKNSAILYCVIFTVITLADNIWQLFQGQIADSNYHIINRAVVILIGVITITLFDKLQLKRNFLANLLSYVISMSIVFLYVWITSFWDELSPGAYQGVFITFTGFAITCSIIINIKNRIKEKNKWQHNK